MKRIISAAFIILFPVIASAEFNSGPVVGYDGKPSVSGQSLFKWFSPYNADWQESYFIETNEALVEWEIEKMFKEKIFKMDFFPKTYVNADFAVNYLFLNPAAARKMLPLMKLFYQSGHSSYGFNIEEKLMYLLLKMDSGLKEKISRQYDRKHVDVLIKKYDEIYAHQKLPSPEELKQKAYEKYLNSFKRSNSSISMNAPEIKNWSENWDIEDIVRDILKQKAVTEKNLFVFIRLLEYADKISDSLAADIIHYFKLDTSSPRISETSLGMLGKNPALDKALLKSFKHIKIREFPNAHYLAAALTLNIKIPPKSNSRLLVKSAVEVSPQFILTYARLTSYDKAFALFLKEKERFFEFFYGDRGGIDTFSWQAAIYLLGKGSKLSRKEANTILEKNIPPDPKYKFEISSKFSKLLKNKNLQLDKSLSQHLGRLPLGASFPFDSLTPEAQEMLFKTYSDIMMREKGYETQKKAVLERFSSIKSSKYRHKAIRLLIENESRQGDEALQAVSLKWLPELLEIAGGDDPVLAVKACELVGKTSLFGRAAAPKLRRLLASKADFTVKIAAICALAEIGDKDSIPIIEKYINARNKLLARAAKQAVYILQPLDEKDKFFEEMLRNKPRSRRW